MSNKTPFEIRLDLLVMAKDYLQKQHEQATAFAMVAFKKQLELGEKIADDWKTIAPPMFTIDDIVKQATALGSFVSNVGSKRLP